MATEQQDSSERGFTMGKSAEPEGDSVGASLPKIDFSTFVISLGTSALFHMGVVGEAEDGERPPKNLVLARQTIDTLEMLAEKTRGNLGEQEAKLLESLLYELRMRFVEARK
jgi:hypothetical protein